MIKTLEKSEGSSMSMSNTKHSPGPTKINVDPHTKGLFTSVLLLHMSIFQQKITRCAKRQGRKHCRDKASIQTRVGEPSHSELKITVVRNQEDSSVLKGTCCSWRGLDFSFQHWCWVAHNCSSAPVSLTPISGLLEYSHTGVHINTHTHR